jgi:hypothetical protein
MFTWYGAVLLIIVVLLVLLVIRVSEISTRMHIIEGLSNHITADYEVLQNHLGDYCTYKELRAILRVSPAAFAVGTNSRQTD